MRTLASSAKLHAAPRRSRGWVLLVLIYPVLALIGALTHRQAWSLAAILLLLTLLMGPVLRTRRPLPWLLWLVLVAGMLWLAAHGLAALVLGTVPVLVNLLLAWLFGRSLRRGRQPLVARVIEAVEGPQRLALPPVARYARQLTWFWTALLAAQGMALLLVQVFALPGGLGVLFGYTPPEAWTGGWVVAYGHFGSYALIVVAFGLEYLFRRWHLRHLPHLPLHDLVMRLAVRWPQLVRSMTGDR